MALADNLVPRGLKYNCQNATQFPDYSLLYKSVAVCMLLSLAPLWLSA